MHDDIVAYNSSQTPEYREICERLATTITKHLLAAENKVWHGSPVWFLDGNPVVGYATRKAGVVLLFWSGQSFNEEGLKPEGSFKAAQKVYAAGDKVNVTELKRWLAKAKTIQWDYKNIVKRKGKLVRLF